jgi:hypothetical protein
MSIRQRIVSYKTLNSAFTPYLARMEQTPGLESTTGEAVAPPPASALAAVSSGLQILEKESRNPDVMSGTEDLVASLIQTYTVQQAKQFVPAASDGLEAQFDSHDVLGWAGSFLTWWKKIVPHAWQAPQSWPDAIADRFRAAVFGDWGTGLYGAPVLARAIATDKAGFQLILHLGDTYYSGDTGEIQERLLADWPAVAGAVNRSLNGNHEMYTGGHAYFDTALKKFAQPSSCFALQNDHWLLVGVDSAYADHDLYDKQMPWLESVLGQCGARKLILFSHHQPFSLLDVQGPKLVAKLEKYLDNKRVFAWYWGHEHRCVLYDAHPAWGLRGRCIGHGGFPYFRDGGLGAAPAKPAWARMNSKNLVPGGEMLDGVNPYISGHETEYGPHGYVVLEFDGPGLNEFIVDPDGTPLRTQQLAP